MIIVWSSRHRPTPRQTAELTRLFGQHRLIIDSHVFTTAENLVHRYHTVHHGTECGPADENGPAWRR